MEFKSLYSSSSGNAYIVSDRDTRILIECGVSWKKLQKATGFEITKFSGVLVSHEHKDHAKAVPELIRDGAKIYMSAGTADALEVEAVELIEHGEQFTVGTMEVVPFTTYHDAKEPLGFLVKSWIDGDVLAFATDTVNLAYHFPGVSILAVEANFDRDVLEGSQRMPEKVRKRIANSHMDIDVLCRYLAKEDLSQCREIWLLHLSDGSSREWEFLKKVRAVVPAHVRVEACGKG